VLYQRICEIRDAAQLVAKGNDQTPESNRGV
jgi:hypothetical protein